MRQPGCEVSDSKDPASPAPAIGDLLAAIAARSENISIPQYSANDDAEDAEVVSLTKSDKPKMRDWYGEERAARELTREPEQKFNVRNHSRWAREYAARPKIEDQIEDKLQTAAGRQELAKQFDAILARASFSEFFRQAWKVLEPSTELVWNWHLELMCNIVQAVFMDWLKTKKPGGGRQRHKPLVRNVIFNVPPGSSKSAILARSFQAWAWVHCPGMKFICLSVNDDATQRDARAMRDLVRSTWYVESFAPKWKIKDDQDSVSSFANNEGGNRISMPIKSEIVGLRADCILIDDPNNPKKAESKKERDEVNDLWDVNQFNRVNDMERSLRFGVQQRTNEADWTGHVVDQMGVWSPENKDGWLHVVLPAEYDPTRKFVLPDVLVALLKEHLPGFELVTEDPRTEDGDPIDHERMSKDMLAAERRRWAGTGNYVGQMLQSPSGAEGTMVQRQWWGWFRLAGGVRDDVDELDTGRPRPAFCRTVEEQPAAVIHAAQHAPSRWDFDWIAISLDCASKKTEKGSNYGILVIAGRGGRRYVLDDRTQRGALHEIIAVVKTLVLLWKPDKILVEEKAAGPDVMDTLREQMGAGDVPMVAIEGIEPGNTDKELRLEAAIPYLANGMVYLLDGAPWLEEFVNELSKFPHGVRDDRVDALSQALNHIRAKDDEWPDF